MKHISKLISLFLAISAIRVVSGQLLYPDQQNGGNSQTTISHRVSDQFSNPDQQFGSNLNALVNNFGNTETCQRISECQQFGPIICCPPTRSRPPQGGGTMGGQIGGNGQNERNENFHQQSVSQRKCLENYPPLPIVHKEETIFNITGGERTHPGEYPYMAAIGRENKDGGYDFKCGGFLIDKNFVITTAHCTKNNERGSPSVVRLGGKDLNSGVDIKIARIISHPDNSRMRFYNDIAVIQLESEVLNRPVCLWTSDKINFQEGTAIGYGSAEYAGRASKLMKVKLSIFSNEECSQYYLRGGLLSTGIAQSHLCAGDRNGVKDTCEGDSGGPLLVTSLEQLQIIPYAIGITSFGTMDCSGRVPTVFTRISSFIPWIESVAWPNES